MLIIALAFTGDGKMIRDDTCHTSQPDFYISVLACSSIFGRKQDLVSIVPLETAKRYHQCIREM